MDSQRRQIKKSKSHNEEEEKEEEERLIRCLPQDVAFEILSRLPIRSVVKFRFVCQSWNLLSRDLLFAKTHMSRSLISQSTCLIFHSHDILSKSKNELQFVEFSHAGDNQIVRKFDIPFANSMPSFHVIGSCNGVLCLIDSPSNTKSIYIYNPFTGEYSYIMPPEYIDLLWMRANFGFGFHPVSKEYKLIMIAYVPGNCGSDVEIYDFGSNEWRSLDDDPYASNGFSPLGSVAFCPIGGVLVSGRLHWMYPVGRSYDDHLTCFIMSFDLANDSFEILTLAVIAPNSCEMLKLHARDERDICSLAALGDCISVAVHYSLAGFHYLDVWATKEYGKQESWVKMFTLSTTDVIPQFGAHIICILKNGDILVGSPHGHLVSYNQHNGNRKIIWFQGMPKLFSTTVHVGSLCPLVSYQ